jgi:hypothetical protein
MTYEGTRNSEGKREGPGKMTYSNGDIYDGNWHNDRRHGPGKMTYSAGGSYVGGFKEGKMSGTGKMEYANGELYYGDFKDSKREGSGIHTWPNGSAYKGNWKGDARNGKGTMIDDAQNRYTGTWVDGLKHGFFDLYIPSENGTCKGRYANDQTSGDWNCSYNNQDGEIWYYLGQMDNAKRNGAGTMITHDGREFSGTWTNNALLTGSPTSPRSQTRRSRGPSRRTTSRSQDGGRRNKRSRAFRDYRQSKKSRSRNTITRSL